MSPTALPQPELPRPDAEVLSRRYELQDVVGRGASAVVYRAVDTTLDRVVAIKLLANHDWRSRMIREGRFLAQLTDEHVVRVHDFIDALPSGRAALVLEWVEGGDLLQEMSSWGGAVPEGTVVPWMAHVCQAMIAAETMGIIHRDLKPQNILVDRHRMAKVADFGLARSDYRPQDGSVTADGNLVGTPLYMSPEQVETPRSIDIRSDIYSFGATFYHALTGQPPFVGESLFQVLLKHQNEPVVPPCKIQDDISRSLSALLEKCLAKRPDARYESFSTVLEQLRRSHFGDGERRPPPHLGAVLAQYREARPRYTAARLEAPLDDVYRLEGGRTLRVSAGNIAECEVEAIVNLDDELLTMDLGTSRAIRLAAGQTLTDELFRYGRVREGRAVVTSGGALGAKYVFHGSTGPPGSSPRPDVLVELMSCCFYHADTLGVRTIAFPVIGDAEDREGRARSLDLMFDQLCRLLVSTRTEVEVAHLILPDAQILAASAAG